MLSHAFMYSKTKPETPLKSKEWSLLRRGGGTKNSREALLQV
jgi:hypothetical protein